MSRATDFGCDDAFAEAGIYRPREFTGLGLPISDLITHSLNGRSTVFRKSTILSLTLSDFGAQSLLLIRTFKTKLD